MRKRLRKKMLKRKLLELGIRGGLCGWRWRESVIKEVTRMKDGGLNPAMWEEHETVKTVDTAANELAQVMRSLIGD